MSNETKCDKCGRDIVCGQDVYCWHCFDELQEENARLILELAGKEMRDRGTVKDRMAKLLDEVKDMKVSNLFDMMFAARKDNGQGKR